MTDARWASETAPRYGGVAIALHWVLAVALAALFCVGLYMADLPFSPRRLQLYNWHKWAGIFLLLMAAVRLLWRLTHRPPALPDAIEAAMPSWQRRAYSATHGLMYGLFFAVPLIGWAYSSAAGFPVVWMGMVPLPDWVPVSPALADSLKSLHAASAYALAALVVVHVAAALKHQWIDRDGLMARMLPRWR